MIENIYQLIGSLETNDLYFLLQSKKFEKNDYLFQLMQDRFQQLKDSYQA